MKLYVKSILLGAWGQMYEIQQHWDHNYDLRYRPASVTPRNKRAAKRPW